MKRSHLIRSWRAVTLALFDVIAVIVFTACGGSDISPSPAPSTSWTPGASPVPALSLPAQKATNREFRVGSDGWIFEPAVDIEVTALGFWDNGQDGLVSPHRTAIFDTGTEKAIVSATVQPQSTLDGDFRWESVEPVVLKARHDYMMAWETPRPFDPEVIDPKNASLAPELHYVGYRERWAEKETSWGYPFREVPVVILSGNFKFRPASVASPAP